MEKTEKSVRLTLLGGVNEVGGNIVLLEDLEYDVKVFLDFGIKIKKYKDIYKRNQYPSSIDEIIGLNLLPNEAHIPIENLYIKEFKFVKQNVKTRSSDSSDNDPINDNNCPSNLDGILISHPHKDHYFGLSFINRTIPIYTGVVTKRIIRAYCKSSKSSMENNFNGLNWQTFRTGDIINIKGMKVIPFHVDHSVPGAYGFIIYTSAGPVVYTGDFRRHGPLSNMTEEFLNEIKTHSTILTKVETDKEQMDLISEGTKVLICDGTKIHKGIVESEQLVEENFEEFIRLYFLAIEKLTEAFYLKIFRKDLKSINNKTIDDMIEDIEKSIEISLVDINELKYWRRIRNKVIHENFKINKDKAEKGKEFFDELYNKFYNSYTKYKLEERT